MMKKSLIALAIAAAAPAAFAATSNVDVSGKIAVGVANYSGLDSTKDTLHMESYNSVVTISGTEDLGGGMNAFFSLTNNLDMGGSATNFGEQNQIVGVGGSFGKVLMGKFDNPMKVMARKYDLFADYIGDNRNLQNVGLTDARADNVVAYLTPSFNGVSAAIARANTNQDEVDGAASGDVLFAKVVYENGPMSIGYGYHKADNSASTDEKAQRVVAGYKMGDTRVNLQWQKVDNQGGTAANDSKGLVAGVAHAMGPITLKAQYSEYDLDGGSTYDAKQWTIGADYALSKRTTVMMAYSKLTNESASTANILWSVNVPTAGASVSGSDGSVATAGKDPSAFGIALKHTF